MINELPPPVSPSPHQEPVEPFEDWLARQVEAARHAYDRNPRTARRWDQYLLMAGVLGEYVRRKPAALPVGSPDRRIAELAFEGAKARHVEAAPLNEFLTSRGVHVFTSDESTDYGFAACPHPDCALVRGAAVGPPALPEEPAIDESTLCGCGDASNGHDGKCSTCRMEQFKTAAVGPPDLRALLASWRHSQLVAGQASTECPIDDASAHEHEAETYRKCADELEALLSSEPAHKRKTKS